MGRQLRPLNSFNRENVFARYTMLKTTRHLILSATIISLTALWAQGSGQVVFASGFIGGTYYQIANTITDLPDVAMKILLTKGSTENIQLMRDARADMAMAQLDVFEDATKRDKRVSSGVRILLPIYDEEVHVIAKKNIRTLQGLEGKTVSIGPVGSGTAATSQIIFDAMRIKPKQYDRSDTPEGIKKVLAGQVDALVIVAGAPYPALKKIDADASSKIHMLRFRGQTYRRFTRKAFGFKKGKIRKKTYPWLNKSVRTISVDSVILCKASLSENQVKTWINKIFSNHTELFLGHEKWKQLNARAIKKLLRRKKNLFHPAAVSVLKSKT